jgi:hypothetical protein
MSAIKYCTSVPLKIGRIAKTHLENMYAPSGYTVSFVCLEEISEAQDIMAPPSLYKAH